MHFIAKNCAKSGNSKYSTINQMSYIQKFFEQHLPRFYLEEVRQHLQNPSFILFNNQHNIFDFTLDLILSSKNCLQSDSLCTYSSVLGLLCKVSYEELRDVHLPVKEQDNDIVKLLKTSLKYAHMQMLQILIRLVHGFQESLTAKSINHTLSTLIDEISLIYPALKIQISYSHPEINLCLFFEQYLGKITTAIRFNEISKLFLQQIADKAQLIGPLQKLFKRYTQINKKQVLQSDSKVTVGKNGYQLLGKGIKSSKLDNDRHANKQQQKTAKSGQKPQKFDEAQLFRTKKRKIIMKQRLKQTESGCKTPYRQKDMSHPNTPNTSKTQKLVVRSDTTQNNASSILYRRLLVNKSRPIPERTLYFSQIHKFLPKKSSNFDPQVFIQNITASSLTNDYSNPFEQVVKTTERKISKPISWEKEDNKMFCVPQTPKPDPLRKQQSNSSLLSVHKKPSKA